MAPQTALVEIITANERNPKGAGRHSDYSEELADLICERLADGLSLRRVCEAEDMPNRTTVLRWMHKFPEFAAKCARAKEDQAENDHDTMVEIEQAVIKNRINPKAANVVLANMRWRMEKLKPKVFGARVAVEHSVSDDLAASMRAARARLNGPGEPGEPEPA